MRHRIVPTKAERRQQLVNAISSGRKKKKDNCAGRKNAASYAAVASKNAVRLPTLYLRVRCPHFFDRHPGGTLEAGKLRARINSVKSGAGAWRCRWIDNPGSAVALFDRGTCSGPNNTFFLFPGDASSFFRVKKIFVRDEK
jgi:hypothetical protein